MRRSARLSTDGPTIGICLGAQLIAAALGAKIFPSGHKEIGFAPVTLTYGVLDSPLRHLLDVPVLHWHGDTFELPSGAIHLAATSLVHEQAFAIGLHVLALQFHAEFDACAGFERWLVGHASELAAADIDINQIRADADKFGSGLVAASTKLFSEWIAALPT